MLAEKEHISPLWWRVAVKSSEGLLADSVGEFGDRA